MAEVDESIAAPNEIDVVINGHATRIVTLSYVDRVFVTVSQLKSFGCFITARGMTGPDASTEYDVKTLLGKRDADMHTLIARQVVEAVHRDTGKPLLLAIALASEDMETARGIVRLLAERRPWVRRQQAAPAHASTSAGAAAPAATTEFTSTLRAGPGARRLPAGAAQESFDASAEASGKEAAGAALARGIARAPAGTAAAEPRARIIIDREEFHARVPPAP